MSTKFVITANNNSQLFRDVSFNGSAKSYSLDFSPWAEDNHAVTSATWEVVTGNASVSGETLASNVASALVTFSDVGGVLIKLTAATGTETYVAYFDVLVRDVCVAGSDDYGLIV